MVMPRILACDRVSAAGIELLRKSAEVVELGAPSEDELIEALSGCDGLIVRSATKVTARVLEHAPGLRVIARAGVGVDNIDVEAATRHGVLVVNSPGGNIIAAAEHTLALLLAAARNIAPADASMKAGEFDRKRFIGRQVAGKTLGIVGLGKIGGEVARRAKGLGMELMVYDPYASPELVDGFGARLGGLEELLRTSDFVTVHTPLTEETRGLIGAEELAFLKPNAIVVNCARGGIIDEAALIEALRSGRLAGAALDVFEGEPKANPELVGLPNVVATPHLGASTTEAQEAVAIDAAEQIVEVLAGRPPRTPVNVPALSPELLTQVRPMLVLAARLGRLAGVLTTRAPREFSVVASSTTPDQGMPLIASWAVSRLLEGKTDGGLNEVSALLIARERGIRVSYAVSGDDRGYSRSLEVQVHFVDEAYRLFGAVIEGSQPRILGVNGFSVDLAPEGEYMFLWKQNPRVPGFIGAIGSLLGEAGIGIASIEVGREEIDGTGLLAVRLHDPVPAEVRQAVLSLDGVTRLEVVTFR